jgi:hypothetical protein
VLFLSIRAYFLLLRFELRLMRGDFAGIYDVVRGTRVRQYSRTTNTTEYICHAMDLACVWYWRHVLCLQRSAATVCLLRRYGIPADLVIGTQHTPFKAHAWVEVSGHVVNDRPYTNEIYAVLDRC